MELILKEIFKYFVCCYGVMSSKTVEIDFNKIGRQLQDYFDKSKAWLIDFFNTMDQNESIATGAVGLGFLLLIIGIILM